MLGFKSNISAHVLPKSWFQILIALNSMRCREASLQLIMAGFKSYIPTGIFDKAPVSNFKRHPMTTVISRDGISINILLIPLASKKGSELSQVTIKSVLFFSVYRIHDRVKFITTLHHSRASFHTAQKPSAFGIAFVCIFLNRLFISVQIGFAHWSKLVS